MWHLQPVQTGYPMECSTDTPEDTRKALSKGYTRLTGVVERRGTWKVVDSVPESQRVALAAWANDYESRRTRGIALVHEAVPYGQRR